GAVPSGSAASFTMTVSNAGPDVATDVHFVDTVGSNLTLTGVSCSASGGAICPTTPGAVMDLATLPVGGALTFTVNTFITAGTNGAITNALSATPTNDPDRSDNTAVAVGTANANNVAVTATAPSGPVAGGSTATFAAVVTNAGPSTALDVAITSAVGNNLTQGTPTCSASGGAVCPSSLGASMVAPSIPPGGSLIFSIPTTVSAGSSGQVTYVMSVSAAGDSRLTDNSSSASVSTFSADLGVSQTGPATVGAGGSAIFTAVVANPGPNAATNLQITETLSAGSATVTCAPSAGATCPSTLGTSMTLPSLGAG